MKRLFVLCASCLVILNGSTSAQIPKRISYQGLLTTSMGTPAATGSYDLQFSLWDSASGGTSLWSETQSGVAVQQGTFSVILGVSPVFSLAFDRTYFLEVTAAAGPGISSPVTFSPRSELTSAPYAVRADTAEYAKASPGGGGGPYLPLAGGTLTGAITSTGDPAITMGKGNFGSGNINSGFHAFVAGTGNTASGSRSTIGGGTGNTASGELSAVGGGSFNQASLNNTTIAGGSGSEASAPGATVGGGADHIASGNSSTVAGGSVNTASGDYSVVGGGSGNTASGNRSVVAGGQLNKARGLFSFIGGGGGGATGGTAGDSNSAIGDYSVIPGGRANIALGRNSLAAGWRAKANHTSTFVWADSGVTSFTSTAANQFLIRAAGGVGIGTASPTKALEVAGSARVSDTLFASNVSSNSPLRLQTNGITRMFLDDATGRVGIGTTSLTAPLTIQSVGNAPTIEFASNGGGVTGIQGSDPLAIATTNSNPLSLVTNNLFRMRITETGNVGIGTEAPQNKLDIEGGAVIGTTYSGTFAAPANGLLVQGNMGVGNSSPSAKLDVTGNAVVSGTLTIGGGAAIMKVLTATATVDFPSTSGGGSSTSTIDVTGAALGDVVALGIPDASDTGFSIFTAWVSAANTVRIKHYNSGGVAHDPASGTFRVMVVQF